MKQCMIVNVAEANVKIFFFYACVYKVNQILHSLRNCVTGIDEESSFSWNSNCMKDPSSYYVCTLKF
jgi:hypothetical protein